MTYGAVLVFKRGKGGHVGFAVGYDPVRKRYRVRGGNQGDMIKDSWLDADRLLASRQPSTYPARRRRPRNNRSSLHDMFRDDTAFDSSLLPFE